MSSRVLALALVVLGCWPHATARAGFIVDQANDQFGVNLRLSIQSLGPIGQSFTPTLSSLNVVELMTKDFVPLNDLGAELFVNIRTGSPSGSILSTSQVVSLPNQFDGLTRFDFTVPVGLVPGDTYVIEVVVASGDNWAAGVTDRFPNDPYGGGTLFAGGQPVSPFTDLWFREGIDVVPAPGGLLLSFSAALVGLGMSLHRRLVRPARQRTDRSS